MKIVFPLLMVAFSFVGCAQKSYVALLENADGQTGSIIVSSLQNSITVNKAGQGAMLMPAGPQPIEVSPQTIEKDFAAAIHAQPASPVNFILYFEQGGSTLTQESIAQLPTIIDTIHNHPNADISIVGHTDTSGNSAANEKLGLTRAEMVQSLLEQKGIRPLEITVTSHGEHDPIVPTTGRVSEPLNRRVEVIVR